MKEEIIKAIQGLFDNQSIPIEQRYEDLSRIDEFLMERILEVKEQLYPTERDDEDEEEDEEWDNLINDDDGY